MHPTTPPADRVRIAIDVGPLYGHRTGVGIATAGIVDALAAHDDVDLDAVVIDRVDRVVQILGLAVRRVVHGS